ncbi:hypothetical protein DFH29DRAFT_951763 [Suillus ampliporus]|nr:hypothetical protein DFH29DRAFT_951763 [Suillus ampliporus]
MAENHQRSRVAAEPERATNPEWARVAENHQRSRVAAEPERAANPEWARVAKLRERARVAANPERTRVAKNAQWSSMANDSSGICLDDDGRIIKHTGSHQQGRNHPRITFTASFSSHPAVPELAGFLDISGVSGITTPRSFHICVPRRSRHGDYPCYDGVCNFCKRSTGTKPISF